MLGRLRGAALAVALSPAVLGGAACDAPPVAPPVASSAASPVAPACDAPATRIHAVQGKGRSSPLLGREDVVVDGVVVGAFPGFPEGLGGFFVQEEDADTDADPLTSEGLFVFDPDGAGAALREGDRVRVRGRVSEFFGMTEIAPVEEVVVCPPKGGAGTTPIPLPVADPADWERWEGMRVRIPGPLVATGHHALGRFGELALAAGGRLVAPTDAVLPGPPALERAAADARRRVLLDDGSDAYEPEPTPWLLVETPAAGPDGDAAGTVPLERTLRLGDVATAVEGVVEFAFGRFRIHPTRSVRLVAAGARPDGPPAVGGTVRVVGWNVENHFNGDGRGGGFPTRGPRSATELARQRAGIVEALARMDADVVALVELENDGTGPESTLRQLAEAVSARTPDAPYAVVETPGRLGTRHAIAVGLLYRPGTVAPLGAPAVLDAAAHPGFDDARNRPSLAWTFVVRAGGERVTVVVSHFKSKGSSCAAAGDPDRGDGQGECPLTRLRAAEALVEWVASDPTGSGGAPVLLLGDLNAYAREDPVRAIEKAGYFDLLAWHAGPAAHTYVFDGAAGRLDHALADAALWPRVTGAGVWHAHADEPPVLGYRVPASDPAEPATPLRASDHDPVLVGLFPDAGDAGSP